VRATSVGVGGDGGGTRQSVACEPLTARWSSIYACMCGAPRRVSGWLARWGALATIKKSGQVMAVNSLLALARVRAGACLFAYDSKNIFSLLLVL